MRLMREFVWLARSASSKNSRCLCLCISILLLGCLPAWGKLGRAVYVNGYNYRVFYTSDDKIAVAKGLPDASGWFRVANEADIIVSSYKVCRTYNKVPGESLAVFNNKLYYAYTADTPASPTDTTSCSAPGQNKMSVWVAEFDLNPLAPVRWISNRALGQVGIHYSTNSASGAAIAVFDNQLYLFADSGIWTSANGREWGGPNAGLMDSSIWQPLDAVTIYPPNTTLYNGPRILIVYGRQTQGTYYNTLWGATWNGKWGTAKDYYDVGSPFSTLEYIGGTVSLLPGTASFNGWGAKEAAVQLFLKNRVGSTDKVQHIEFTYGTSLGRWRVDPTAYGSDIRDLSVFHYSLPECNWLYRANWDLRQQINVNWVQSGESRAFIEGSDALTPQNRDVPILACGDTGGTETDTTEADPGDPSVLATRLHYWTLVGVILGSPPFAQNGYTAFPDFQNFSNVNFGQGSSDAVEQTNSMSDSIMISQGYEVHTGIENIVGVGVSMDSSYKYAWERANGDTVSKQLKVDRFMGTQASACTELGRWGWALFMAPTFVYQNWRSYAYDYSHTTGVGSPLSVDLHTIKVKDIPDNPGASFAPVLAQFELANPGGPNDQYPGLMSGMQPLSSSLNTSFWFNPGYTWRSDGRWQTKLGDGTLPVLQFVGGAGQEESYSQSTQSFESSGTTTELSLTVGLSLSGGTKINGMSQTTKFGVAGSLKSNTKTTTGFGTQVKFGMRMRSCSNGGPACVNSLSVQPYWLQAGAGAPWIPTAFRNQKPWAITWRVKDIQPLGGMNITSPSCPAPTSSLAGLTSSSRAGSSPGTDIAGGRAGTSLPPAHASGRVVSGMGGGLGGEPYSHYSIQGGRLAWAANGTEERIPMTAEEFDPSKGVSVQIQNLLWSLSSGNGTWIRSGDTWTFKPNGENRISMKIDFRTATYELHIQKADLSGHVPAGTNIVRLLVTVNDLYMFYADMEHDLDVAWRWRQPAADDVTLHVTSFEGRYSSANKAGNVSIAGTLPADLAAFGDLEVNVNEHPVVARLVGREDFHRAVQSGGTFKYAKEGLILSFDFGSKTWSATFNNKAFHELLVPQVGVLRTRLSVGGVPWYQAENAVLDYSAKLTLSK